MELPHFAQPFCLVGHRESKPIVYHSSSSLCNLNLRCGSYFVGTKVWAAPSMQVKLKGNTLYFLVHFIMWRIECTLVLDGWYVCGLWCKICYGFWKGQSHISLALELNKQWSVLTIITYYFCISLNTVCGDKTCERHFKQKCLPTQNS